MACLRSATPRRRRGNGEKRDAGARAHLRGPQCQVSCGQLRPHKACMKQREESNGVDYLLLSDGSRRDLSARRATTLLARLRLR
jgi:hypothetical protein